MCFRTAGQTLLNIATILFKQVSRLFTINHSMKRTVKTAWALKRSNAWSLSSTARQWSSLSHHASANRSETMKLQTIKFLKKMNNQSYLLAYNKQKKKGKAQVTALLGGWTLCWHSMTWFIENRSITRSEGPDTPLRLAHSSHTNDPKLIRSVKASMKMMEMNIVRYSAQKNIWCI